MSAVLSAFLLTFAGLFPIVNPIEAAPFFLALTPNLSNDERCGLARRVAINGFLLLLGSMVLGPWLLVFFGIDLPVVRIAGGLVVTALGWKLLTEEQWSDHGEASVQPGGPRRVACHRGFRGGGCDRAQHLHRLSVCWNAGALVGDHGVGGDGAVVGVHFDVHWDSDCLEWV